MLLTILQLVFAVLLVISILLQNRGSGLGSAFGANQNSVFSTKRGAEKYLHISTIILSILFLGTAFINIIL